MIPEECDDGERVPVEGLRGLGDATIAHDEMYI